ncbi:hypothetical protein Pcinc_036403 [Petrolisthes cinctipes]|uniref:Uncharacterized protein n=1 Tax=Petrolisthes cinctipes TaxID=88211 RepID=A0AAE1BVR8_PETCI|nr:hypothetical protein Pcinc_036403 [Petrolisthes cinctipes]
MKEATRILHFFLTSSNLLSSILHCIIHSPRHLHARLLTSSILLSNILHHHQFTSSTPSLLNSSILLSSIHHHHLFTSSTTSTLLPSTLSSVCFPSPPPHLPFRTLEEEE